MSLIASDIKGLTQSFQANLQDGKINLKNGDVIRATVIRNLPDGGALLSAGGKQLSVMTGLNLPEGSSRLFQVSLTGSRIELKPVEAPAGKADQPAALNASGPARETLTGILTELKSALDQAGLSSATGRAVQNLRQLMPLILYANPKDHNGIWVKENLIAGGLLWESKVADLLLSVEKSGAVKKLMKGDLKGILLSLQKGLLAEGGDGGNALMLKIKQALSMIEGNQQLGLSTLEQGLGWLFFVPGLEKDGFLGAEIFSRKRDEKGGIFFSVLLDFTRLGRFQANVAMTESLTSVRILTDDGEKARLVEGNLELLEKGLRALGIKNLHISCDIRKEEEALEEMIPELKKRTQTVSILV